MHLKAEIIIKDGTLGLSIDSIERFEELLNITFGIVGQEAAEIISTTMVAKHGPFIKNKIEKIFTTSRATVVKIVVYET